MHNFKCISLEANKYWILDELLNALSKVKGKKLTELEETYLSAALLRVDQDYVSNARHIELKSLRITLARGLYSYIKILVKIDHKKRIGWYDVAKLLEKANYKRPSVNKTVTLWKSISKETHENYAKDIIDAFENRLVEIIIKGEKPNSSIKFKKKLEDLANQEEKLKNYDEAIEYYKTVLEKNPKSYSYILVKIVNCLNEMELYKDSVPLALFAFQYVKDEERKSRLNGYLGSAFYELALKTLDENILQESLKYYALSENRAWGINVLAKWNSFELLIKFSQLKRITTESFSRKIKLAFFEFMEVITKSNSNFYEYKKFIINDARKIKASISDEYLIKGINQLIEM